MTQKQLGEIIGVSRTCINEIENRRTLPHLFTTWKNFCDLEKRHERERRITASLRRPFWSKIISRVAEK